MNIYGKLIEMRRDLSSRNIKKSGRNKFAEYSYYELADMLPHILELEHAHNVISLVSYAADIATLTFIDAEKPNESIVFSSPMSTAQIKGCHGVQNLGAVQTYIRRYLYTTAFEIVEADALDSTMQPSASPSPSPKPAASLPKPTISPTQSTNPLVATVLYEGEQKGYAAEKVVAHAQKKYGKPLNKLSSEQLNEMIRGYKQIPVGEAARATPA